MSELWEPLWEELTPPLNLVNRYGRLRLNYKTERYQMRDDGNVLTDMDWHDIVNTRSLPEGRTDWNATGQLITFDADEPVIGYDPVTGVKLGNRILQQYENLATGSENLTSGWYTSSGSPIITHHSDALGMSFSSITGGGRDQTQGGGTGNYTIVGWFHEDSAANVQYFRNSFANNVSIGYNAGVLLREIGPYRQRANTGNNVSGNKHLRLNSGAIVSGLQFFPGTVDDLPPYIPTPTNVAGSVPAETQALTGDNFTRVWNNGQCCVYAEVMFVGANPAAARTVAMFVNPALNFRLGIDTNGAATAVVGRRSVPGTGASEIALGSTGAGQFQKVIWQALAGAASQGHQNGIFYSGGALALAPTVTRFEIGQRLNTLPGNIYLLDLIVFDPLSQSTRQRITL